MPEGDTLFKVAGFMQPRMAGQVLRRAEAARSRLPELEGQVVQEVTAAGKHLLVRLPHWVLRVHLGMYGGWHCYAVGEAWRKPRRLASVVLTLDRDVFVCFSAQDVECLRPDELGRSQVGQLGPDLLGDTCDLVEVMRRTLAQPPGTPLVDLLLNQRVAAGLGNVYKSELLFIGRLHPLADVHAVAEPQLRALWRVAREQLHANTGGWRRTTTYDRRTGARDTARLYVYGRKGQCCRACNQPVVRDDLGIHRRSTYWCPNCQLPQNRGGFPEG